MSLNEIYTTTEAATLWGLANQTIKQSCSGQRGLPPRFTLDECRKSGKVWLITRQGMERVYGKRK